MFSIWLTKTYHTLPSCMNTLFRKNFSLQREHTFAHRTGLYKISQSGYAINMYQVNWGGACEVMLTSIGNGLDDTSSNPGWGWLHYI